jgi:methyl coenzyme M reductase alpha subunit
MVAKGQRFKIQKWTETAAEKSLRLRGHSEQRNAVIETGTQFSLRELRKDQSGSAVHKIMKALHGLKNAAADQKWDDDKCAVVVGLQIRNNWELDADGFPVETGSEKYLDKIAQAAVKERWDKK